MKNKTNVYILQPILDDPRYEGFGVSIHRMKSVLGREDFMQDLNPLYFSEVMGRNYYIEKFGDRWPNPKGDGRVQTYQDFPCMNLCYPVFSERACQALADFLEPNGELLPIKNKIGNYYYYHITNIVDALDIKKSKADFYDEDVFGFQKASRIKYYFLKESIISKESIFRLIESDDIYVTQRLVDRVHEHGLNGFDFIKVWPLPPGTDYEEEHKKQNKKKFKATKDLKKHTLVLRFEFAKIKANAQEKKLYKKHGDDLDAQLAVPTMSTPYFGSFEGSEPADFEYRIFISCPDVDKLVKKLSDWLETLEWPGMIYVMKRYGDMYDPDAKEEYHQLQRFEP